MTKHKHIHRVDYNSLREIPYSLTHAIVQWAYILKIKKNKKYIKFFEQQRSIRLAK